MSKTGMATLATGPVWVDHTQEQRTYSVRHLHPRFVDVFFPAVPATRRRPGRAATAVKVRITYSHHCFTRSLAKVPNADPEHHYTCTRRPTDRRVFCPVRWKESFALPDIVSEMKHCYFTRHHNYFVWRAPSNTDLGEYFVYFSVTRRGGYVEIEIESAYPRTDGAAMRKGARRVTPTTLIVNAANGRRTHSPA